MVCFNNASQLPVRLSMHRFFTSIRFQPETALISAINAISVKVKANKAALTVTTNMDADLPTLSPKLWCKILNFAVGGDARSLARLSHVCRHFRGLVLHSPLLWKHVVIVPRGHQSRIRRECTPLIHFTTDRLGPCTESLSVISYVGLSHPDALGLVEATQGALRSLRLQYVTFNKVQDQHLYPPTRLSERSEAEIDFEDKCAAMARSCMDLIDRSPSLEVLELMNLEALSLKAFSILDCILNKALRELPRLRKLRLNCFIFEQTTAPNARFQTAGQHFLSLNAVGKNLVHLDLSFLHFYDNVYDPASVYLSTLAAATPALQTLLAREWSRGDDDEGDFGLRFVQDDKKDAGDVCWESLEFLDISQIGMYPDIITQSKLELLLFGSRSPALRELRLNHHREALSRLVGVEFPSLQVLHANGCVGDVADAEAVRRLEGQLEELHVDVCFWESFLGPCALDICFRESNPTLKRLDLGRSDSTNTLERVLKNCQKLEWLRVDLPSDEGDGKVFPTPDEIAELRRKIMLDK